MYVCVYITALFAFYDSMFVSNNTISLEDKSTSGREKKGMQVLLVEEREIKLLVDLNKKKKELLFLSFDDSLHTDKKESSDVTSF
jgi:hypothetical protein